MSKKLIYLVSVVLVLGLALTSVVEAADPSLVGWWKFDDGSGTIAKDSSGRNMHGVLGNDPVWREDGVYKGCLFFDGDRAHVRIAHEDSLNPGSGSFTVTFWGYVEVARGTRGSTVWDLAVNKRDSGSVGYYIGSNRDQGGTANEIGYRFMLGDTAANRTDTPYVAVPLGDWVFVAAVLDRGQNVQKISGDGGQTWATTTPPPGPIAPAQDLGIAWDIGINDYWFHGRIDDVALFSRALTDEEIQQVMMGPPPGLASEPSPAHEATDVPREVVLNWTPGDFAAPTNGHKVYLGQSFNDVNDATGGVAQDANSYTPAQRLDFNTTYYWRIDEVNAPPTSQIEFKGEVWQLTTEPVAYAIENIIATASSTHQADTDPENTINGSGLDANDLHSIEPADMWLSGDEPNGAWIEYELDKVHKLHQMWVWNHNGMLESVLGFGIKDVTIEYSTNGTDYTTLGTTHEFARAPGTPDYAHNTTVDFGGVTAKYVRLTANSNWGGILDQYGLSEVRFFSIPVFAREPSPDSGTTDVAVDVTLGFRAGREADTHDVYLSTDEQAVIDGNAPVTTVTETNYGPLSLDLGTTYYWKINEVNEAETTTTWQGDIWN
ncbi:MAG: discoidin domain-containing protein, partial [Planctomycetes bacterium]|nr:discoidin domain-containing protein [Planctomycetota bacterium]